MTKKVLAAGILALVVSIGWSNLLVNGDFEAPFEGSWDTLATGAGFWAMERSDTLGSGTGYAARAYKYLADYASIAQTVPVVGADLALSFDARLWVNGGSPSCWPVAALIVRYLDTGGTELGSTKFYCHDEFAQWQSSDTAHLVDVSRMTGWNHYDLNIRQEITENLPGVNPARVGNVRVELYAFDSGT